MGKPQKEKEKQLPWLAAGGASGAIGRALADGVGRHWTSSAER